MVLFVLGPLLRVTNDLWSCFVELRSQFSDIERLPRSNYFLLVIDERRIKIFLFALHLPLISLSR